MFLLELLDCFGSFRPLWKGASLVLVMHMYCKLAYPSSPRLQHILLGTSRCWNLIQVTGTCLYCCKWLRLILHSSHGQTSPFTVLFYHHQLLLPHYERVHLQLNRIMTISCPGSTMVEQAPVWDQESRNCALLQPEHLLEGWCSCLILVILGVCIHVVECTDCKSLNKQNNM